VTESYLFIPAERSNRTPTLQCSDYTLDRYVREVAAVTRRQLLSRDVLFVIPNDRGGKASSVPAPTTTKKTSFFAKVGTGRRSKSGDLQDLLTLAQDPRKLANMSVN
jgi:hypothetical protein